MKHDKQIELPHEKKSLFALRWPVMTIDEIEDRERSYESAEIIIAVQGGHIITARV